MKNLPLRRFASAVLLFLVTSSGLLFAQETTFGPWVMQSSGTTAGLRGIHAVGGGVAWASGTGGTVLRTEDSGYVWQRCAMLPGAEKLDFRGVQAWDANTAMVMSSGPGNLSRIYRTTDGCSHWTLVMTNPDKDGFWDAMVFWGGENAPVLGEEDGILLGDPVHGVFQRFDLRRRGDEIVRGKYLNETPAPEGAAIFAASNSSIALGRRVLKADHPILWFGTGGKPGAFVYGLDGLYKEVSAYYPQLAVHQWSRAHVPLAGGTDASGVFSLAFRDGQHGVAVGGDYTKPNDAEGTAAWTADGGEHWTAAARPPHGYRSSVAWDAEAEAWIAVGTNGSDISHDDGKTWLSLDNGNWNALSLPWVVGPRGRIAKLSPGKLPKK
jgi:photosystem II stability/assembly factor-like uncharacterized protein